MARLVSLGERRFLCLGVFHFCEIVLDFGFTEKLWENGWQTARGVNGGNKHWVKVRNASFG